MSGQFGTLGRRAGAGDRWRVCGTCGGFYRERAGCCGHFEGALLLLLTGVLAAALALPLLFGPR